VIHSKHQSLEITPETIARLHKLSQEGAGDAGLWKSKNNEIIEFDQFGKRSVRFVPLSAKDTKPAIAKLCEAYEIEMKNHQRPTLVIASLFILDFLCIHPFRDGNGRVSRLLSLLSLYQSGFNVGKYISLERIIEENKESYYEALKFSSKGWHQQKHDSLPWIHFCLSILRQAYKEMAENVERNDSFISGKGEIIAATVLKQIGSFSLRDIQQQCPHVSTQMIKKILNDMKANNQLVLVGRGRGARWKIK
jgi:Fic family protein